MRRTLSVILALLIGASPSAYAEQENEDLQAMVNGPGAFGRQVKLAVRTTADPRALVASVRGETMEDRLGALVAPQRFSVVTLSSFAVGAFSSQALHVDRPWNPRLVLPNLFLLLRLRFADSLCE